MVLELLLDDREASAVEEDEDELDDDTLDTDTSSVEMLEDEDEELDDTLLLLDELDELLLLELDELLLLLLDELDDRDSSTVLVDDSLVDDELDADLLLDELDDDQDAPSVLVLDDELDEEVFDDVELDELTEVVLEVCDILDAVCVEADVLVDVLDELTLLVEADATTVLDELDVESEEAV